jgi:hypothetical protein
LARFKALQCRESGS